MSIEDLIRETEAIEQAQEYREQRDRQQAVTVLYRNYRGEIRERRIRPIDIKFDSNEWHPTPQWLMDVIDLETGRERTFAMKDIRDWRA